MLPLCTLVCTDCPVHMFIQSRTLICPSSLHMSHYHTASLPRNFLLPPPLLGCAVGKSSMHTPSPSNTPSPPHFLMASGHAEEAPLQHSRVSSNPVSQKMCLDLQIWSFTEFHISWYKAQLEKHQCWEKHLLKTPESRVLQQPPNALTHNQCCGYSFHHVPDKTPQQSQWNNPGVGLPQHKTWKPEEHGCMVAKVCKGQQQRPAACYVDATCLHRLKQEV